MSVNWNEYTKIENLEEDIRTIKIQGATNVALAVVRGMELVASEYTADPSGLLENVIKVGDRLAHTRNNEPLARNAVKYLSVMSRIKKVSETNLDEAKTAVSQICGMYLSLIEDSKKKMIESIKKLGPINTAFTHCHSSTVEKMLKYLSDSNPEFKVVCSETRPFYQGRITAQNLINLGVDTTMIVDSAAPAFVADMSYFPIDVVFIGSDEITIHGDVINKIGSFPIAVAADMAGTPLYAVASLLKVNPDTAFKHVEIEQRNPYEVWPDAPQELKIYNPAFEITSNRLISGFITESGIVKPEDIARVLHETYDWVF